MQVQHSYNSSTNGLISLTHVFTLSTVDELTNKNPAFHKNRTHDFHTSKCAGYLQVHSGDELLPSAASGQFRLHQVKQLRTEGVHCRESADKGPVALKI